MSGFLSQEERAALLALLDETATRLENYCSALTPEQAVFRASEGRWNTLELLTHIVLTEQGVLRGIHHALRVEGDPEALARCHGRDERILRGVRDRSRQATAPEQFVPRNVFATLEQALKAFRNTRMATREFTASTQADLRAHHFRHFVLRDMDCYQWLLLLAAHCDRHVAQMQEQLGGPSAAQT